MGVIIKIPKCILALCVGGVIFSIYKIVTFTIRHCCKANYKLKCCQKINVIITFHMNPVIL